MSFRAPDGARFRTTQASSEQLLASLPADELRGHLLALQSVTEAALANRSLSDLLRELLPRLREALRVDTASVLLRSPDGARLEVRASAGLEEEVEERVEIPLGAGISGMVAARGEAVIVDEVARVPVASPALRKLASMMAAPLRVDDDLLGVIHVGTLQPRRFAESDLHLLQVAADRIALAIQNARLHDEAQARSRERDDARAAQEHTESRFRVYAESVSDAVFAIDEDSVVLYANPAVERIFGHPPDEVIGKPLTVLMPERMRGRHDEGMRRYLGTGRRNVDWSGAQLPGLHRDGHEIPLEISFGEYVRDGKRYFTGVARDITERVRAQQDLEELAAELEVTIEDLRARTEEAEAANQAKTDFMGVISHELRTPLSAIIGYTELLRMGIPVSVPEQAREQLERIERAARHQLQLVEEILSFSRLQNRTEEVRRERVDLVEIARDAVMLLDPVARRKGLSVEVEAEVESLELTTDSGKVRQILANLLSNAVKFTREGSIRVRVGRGERQAWVAVEDTGIGIDAQHLPRVFDPFWQVEQGNTREVEGMGLGLTIAKQLAGLLGGEIRGESTRGEGSAFTLTLPLGSGSLAGPSESGASAAGGGERPD